MTGRNDYVFVIYMSHFVLVRQRDDEQCRIYCSV